MTRAIGSLNMGLCRVLLAPWMISRRFALKTGAYRFLIVIMYGNIYILIRHIRSSLGIRVIGHINFKAQSLSLLQYNQKNG